MKKSCLFLCFVSFLFFISCSSHKSLSPYSVTVDDTVFTVDTVAGTISDGENVFNYSITGEYPSYSIQITYPNGATFHQNIQEGEVGSWSSGGWSNDYDPDLYIDGNVLCRVLEQEAPSQSNSKNYVAIIIVLIIGLINLFSPHTAWYLSRCV